MDNDKRVALIFAGDTVPTDSNVDLFKSGDAESLVGKGLFEQLQGADLVVANLEAPLADRASPIVKNGPNLIAATASAHGLSALGIDVVALANNHIMDQGAEGLASTLRALDAEGIQHLGAGDNLAAAAVPFIFEKDGIKGCIYACAEHEFSVAGETSPGANPFDPLRSLDCVEELKARCDFLAVLYHGGKEHYRYPSPGLRDTCRRLAEKGADLVVCQHSHCVGCMEEWVGSAIVYGQGNFLFDRSDSEFWRTGLLLRVDVGREGFSTDFIPLCKDGSCVRLAEGEEGDAILSGFRDRSRQILEPGFVGGEYARLAADYLPSYVRAFVPGARGMAFRILDKVSGGRLSRAIARRVDRLAALNYLECEAHRELFSSGIRELRKEGSIVGDR